MPKYEVIIDLNSMAYEIEADNEEEATQSAVEIAHNETPYDLLKWADYTAKEIACCSISRQYLPTAQGRKNTPNIERFYLPLMRLLRSGLTEVMASSYRKPQI